MIGGLLVSVAHIPALLLVCEEVVGLVDAVMVPVFDVMAWGVTKALKLEGNVGMSGVLICPRKIFPSTSL